MKWIILLTIISTTMFYSSAAIFVYLSKLALHPVNVAGVKLAFAAFKFIAKWAEIVNWYQNYFRLVTPWKAEDLPEEDVGVHILALWKVPALELNNFRLYIFLMSNFIVIFWLLGIHLIDRQTDRKITRYLGSNCLRESGLSPRW